jgi:hypothetical protein
MTDHLKGRGLRWAPDGAASGVTLRVSSSVVYSGGPENV